MICEAQKHSSVEINFIISRSRELPFNCNGLLSGSQKLWNKAKKTCLATKAVIPELRADHKAGIIPHSD